MKFIHEVIVFYRLSNAVCYKTQCIVGSDLRPISGQVALGTALGGVPGREGYNH